MPEVPELDRPYGAACLVAAIETSLGGFLGKEKKLNSALSHAQEAIHWPGHRASFCRELLQYALTFEDFEDLLPFLEVCSQALPMSLETPVWGSFKEGDVLALDDLILYAMRCRELQSALDRQPEVEGWVLRTAQRIVELFTEVEGFRWDDRARITFQQLSVAIAVHDLMGGVPQYFETMRRETQLTSFLGRCIGDIRRALEFTVDWLLGDEPGAPGERVEHGEKVDLVENKLRVLSECRFDPIRMSARESLRGVRFYVERLHAFQRPPEHGGMSEMEDYGLFLQCRGRIPALAALVQSSPLFRDLGEDANERYPLPAGLLTVARALATERGEEQWLLYSADGPAGVSAINLVGNEVGDMLSTDLHVSDKTFASSVTHVCSFDASGKPFIFLDRDHLAPPLGSSDFLIAYETLRRANVRCSRWIFEKWLEDPDLINRSTAYGPLLLVLEGDTEIVVCHQEAEPVIAGLRNWKPDEEQRTRGLLSKLHITSQRELRSFSMHAARPPQLSEQSEAQRSFRRLIREYVGRDRIPSLDWIVGHLKLFGVQQMTTGKGSHGSLLLARSGSTRKQNTWCSIRSTESLDWFLLWQMLHQLDISEEEFYNKCVTS